MLLTLLAAAGRVQQAERPRFTYEKLAASVLEPDRQLTFEQIVSEIQNRYPYYANGDTPTYYLCS